MEPRQLLAADLIISEFMARNSSGLVDETGERPDWIEIQNRGDEAADLSTYFLTDDANDLEKWAFPSQELGPGQLMVVFASGEDRDTVGEPLHTNFSLSGDGEYLALTQEAPLADDPSHVEVVSEYAPAYPQQLEDISYGVAQQVDVDSLVEKASPARLFFPTNDALGDSWKELSFSDNGWTLGTNAVGYESSIPGFTVEVAASRGTVDSIADALAVVNGSNVASRETQVTPVVNFFDPGGGGGTGNYADDLDFPNDTGGDDNDFGLRATGKIVVPSSGTYTFGVNGDDGSRVIINDTTVINDDSLHAPQNRFGTINLSEGVHDIEVIFFERGGGAEFELFAGPGNFSTFRRSVMDLVGDVDNGGLAVFTDASAGNGSQGQFSTEFATDVGDSMRDVSSSAYIRSVLFVEDRSSYETLTLRTQYDGGFVAYLNGTEIARRNVPDEVSFDSTALTNRNAVDAVSVENIDVSAQIPLLNNGINVLAVQALNDSAGSDEFLFTSELVELSVSDDQQLYFEEPTPGDFNNTEGIESFLLDEISFSHEHGFHDAPFDLTINALTEGVSIRYTLDGTEPTDRNGQTYTGPIRVDDITTIRARALKDGLSPSNVETATFLFVDDVVGQTSAIPTGWPSSRNINGQTLDYGMDRDITNDGRWGPQMEAALKQVPSISFVMDIDDLLGSSQGIYVNASRRGKSWERNVSVEMFDPNGGDGFQVDAGVRIRGGFSRSGGNPKHAFRLFFREEYGDSKLNFPLFGDEGADAFDKIDLRTTQNYSWAFQGDGRNSFIRDVFSRDVQADMGQPSTRSSYYHLYINGNYWGLYQTEERPEARYAATYFGGDPEDYDVVKSSGNAGGYENEATDGTLEAYERLADYFYQRNGLSDANMDDYWRAQGMNPDGTRNPEFERLLDVDNVIDYMIITYYTGDRDGPATRFVSPRVNNYFGIYNRENPDGFKFFEHDSEHSLGTGENDMVNPFSSGGSQFRYFNPHWMHERLAETNSEYRARFNDRVNQHFTGDGALTPENALAVVDTRAAQFDTAIIAESARWGDSKRSTPYDKDNWENAVDGVRNFIRNRIPTVMNQFRGHGWISDVNPPQFTVNGNVSEGGQIDSGDTIGFFSTASTTFETILNRRSEWKFLAGQDLGTAWRQSDFNDAAWSSGDGPFGYGDGDEETVVPCGPNAPNCGEKYVTTYFRKSFNVDNPQQYVTLSVRLQRDDGAAVYLNGKEVVRDNLNANADFDTFASGVVGGGDESTYFEFEVDPADLVDGENVIAVEIHQQNAGSSDISFDLELAGGKPVDAGNLPVYYTTDGSDPRAIGGSPSPTATRFNGAFSLAESSTVKTRTFENNQWSAIATADFLVNTPANADNLRISEINYNPHDALTNLGEVDVDNDRFEFVELANVGDSRIDLTGVEFVLTEVDGDDDGITFRFATQTLAAGERIVVVRDRAAFASRYGTDVRIAEAADEEIGVGVYEGSLRNSGEQLTLLDAQGEVIQQFMYDDSGAWPERADGNASSLEIRDLNADPSAASSYRNSSEFGGSPGVPGLGSANSIVINELLTHTDLPQVDAIELHNPTDSTISVNHWYISDGADDYLRFRLSEADGGVTMAPGSYLTIDETRLGFGFRGQESDDAWLIEADIVGRPLRFIDHVQFEAAQNGVSFGRWPNGSGNLFPQTSLTFGANNSGPVVPDVAVSEIMYAPTAAPEGDALPTEEREFVEIQNRLGAPLDLSHWRLNDAIDYDIPANTILPANGIAVVVAFDPVAEVEKTQRFRAVYGIDATVQLWGPFDGKLDNGGDSVELERPEDIAMLGVGYVLVDRVDYDDAAPWPVARDTGLSINRVELGAYGDLPSNWAAGQPTPGSGSGDVVIPGDLNGDNLVDVQDISLVCEALNGTPVDGADLDGSGQVDYDDMIFLVETLMGSQIGDVNFDGSFDSTDLVLVFQGGEYADAIVGNSTWVTGDWNCDGEFDSSDLVQAFQRGAYVAGATPSATATTTGLIAAAINHDDAESKHAVSDDSVRESHQRQSAKRRVVLDAQSVDALFDV